MKTPRKVGVHGTGLPLKPSEQENFFIGDMDIVMSNNSSLLRTGHPMKQRINF
jgi:hypothetical protein